MSGKRLLSIPAMLVIGIAFYFYHEAIYKSYKLPTTTDEMEECTLIRVVDGDTIEVERGSENVIVRLNGIDAPESVHPNQELNTPEGEAAAAYLNELMANVDTVYLEYDFEVMDSHDRALAYVWYYDDDELIMLNLRLVEDNIADPMTVGMNSRYQYIFEHAAQSEDDDAQD